MKSGTSFYLLCAAVIFASLAGFNLSNKVSGIRRDVLETQRNQAELAAMFLYVEDNLRNDIKRLERKPPLLPEVR